ncbi:hypothetical protein ABZV75_10295 [Streptomyces flaveolus]|uniref:hypothetical protein n=1 Tax=Streptomyces flaveolus TaxID=67297 RepID=UPI0033AC3221
MKTAMRPTGILAGLVIAGTLALAPPSSAASTASDDTFFTTQATKQYTCAKTTCGVKRNLFQDQPLMISCYKTGQRVSGNPVWYYTTTFEGEHWVDGYTPGQHINTGSDPRPGIPRC